MTADEILEKVELIKAEPPLMAVLKLDDRYDPLTEEQGFDILQRWSLIWEGKPPCKLIVLQPGMDLQVQIDPRDSQ